MEHDLARILLSREQIQQRVQALAQEIAAVYGPAAQDVTIVPILSGALIFVADLVRALPLRMKIALIHISSYPGRTTTAQPLRTISAPAGDIEGRHVLIVDDILDSGRTIRHVQGVLAERRPTTIRTAVLLRKPARAPADVRVEFVGFDIDDLFVVGYGLDFDDHYRNLPHIGVLRPELMK